MHKYVPKVPIIYLIVTFNSFVLIKKRNEREKEGYQLIEHFVKTVTL